MESDPASMAEHKHTNRWMTMLALGLLAICLLACLYILIGFPAEAQTVGGSTIDPATTQVPASPTPYQPRRQPLASYAAPAAAPATVQPPSVAVHTDSTSDEIHAEMTEVHNQLRQSQEALQQAAQTQHRVRTTSALFLGVFAIIAGLIVIQVYLQARAWDSDASRAVAEVEAVVTELKTVRDARSEAKSTLPALLQDVGEQPLSFQEEGSAFSPRAQTIIDDIDDLAYVGQGRLVFHDLSTEPEAAVYLNGLLLSAVAHLNRSDPWTAFARLDQFFSQMTRFPDAVERRRIAQAYSYRSLAGYMVLEAQDREPSWQRKTDRAQLESLSKQAFADIAHAASVDPDWRHTTFVEALLCSRFYVPEETADNSSRSDLFVRGLRRAVSLYKGLIEERSYRGPSRRNLARCLKRIAEQTGEKSDFSDFGYGLNAFPTDEELADEALAARQPASQDRFLWQWLVGDEELFANVERLNLAEYRAFWIRMLDTKVHLRNWRADLAELQRIRPAMKEWSVQLLQSDPPITLSNAISRRQERFDSPASGA
jgi:cytoskeletal protein RodZ